MKLYAISLALTLVSVPASAETVVCPDPGKAVQVATCPSEEELRYTFNGFCSDDKRLYARDTDTCVSYENYRKTKNIALWESADGAFQAYLSCDLPSGALKNAKPLSIAVTRQGKLSRVVCSYTDDIIFTYRTKSHCMVPDSGNCEAVPTTCKADCN